MRRLAALLCALLACAAYATSLGNGFAYDDQSIVVENAVVTGPASVGQILASPYWGSRKMGGLYRPFTVATYALNHRVAGLAPFGYHLVNVLLHAAVSALVLLVALEWLGLAGALTAGLLFAVHPIHSEAVSNVVGRAELLAALGVLLAWRLEPRGVGGGGAGSAVAGAAAARGGAWPARLGAAAAFGVGLFSKEVAVTWLGAGLLLAFLRRRRLDLPTWLLYGGITLVYFALRLKVLGALGNPKELQIYRIDNVIATLPFLSGLWTALGVFGRYITLLFFPWRLSADYSWPMIDRAGAGEPWAWLGLVLAAGLLGLTGVAIARTRGGAAEPVRSVAEPIRAAAVAPDAAAFPWAALAVGLGFFALAFFPVSNFLVRIGTVMAERVLYLPSVGFLIALGAVAQWGWTRARGAARPAFVAALVLLCGAGVARCLARGLDWRDDRTLHGVTVRTSPRSARAHANLGIQNLKVGEMEPARVELERAVALDPSYVEAWVNLGSIYLTTGQPGPARHAMEQALVADPTWYTALVGMGGLEIRLGRPAVALPPLLKAVELYRENSEGWYNLGLARVALGDTVKGVEALRESARLAPGDPEALNNLAWYLATVGAFRGSRDEAVRVARAAVGVRPDGNTWDTLAEALARAGRRDEALDACRHALATGVSDTAATRVRMARLQSGLPYPG